MEEKVYTIQDILKARNNALMFGTITGAAAGFGLAILVFYGKIFQDRNGF